MTCDFSLKNLKGYLTVAQEIVKFKHQTSEYKIRNTIDLCCTIAGDIPISVKRLKNAIMTVAIATTPKSSGESNRARIPATTSDIMIPLYLASAV